MTYPRLPALCIFPAQVSSFARIPIFSYLIHREATAALIPEAAKRVLVCGATGGAVCRLAVLQTLPAQATEAGRAPLRRRCRAIEHPTQASPCHGVGVEAGL